MPLLDGKMLPLAMLFVVGFAVIDLANGVCCRSDGNGCCAGCTIGTPYCGYGSCNIFACNCDGGCRTGTGKCDFVCTSPGVERRRSVSLTADHSSFETFNGLDINK